MLPRAAGFWLARQNGFDRATGRDAATLPARRSGNKRREATISYATALYRKAGAATASGRETEILAFRRTLQALEAPGDEAGRVRALGRNHDLWSALVKDLALEGNLLPPGMKQGLLALGLWSMQYSTAAILQNLSPEPLIAVNRNVLEGLASRARGSGPAADARSERNALA